MLIRSQMPYLVFVCVLFLMGSMFGYLLVFRLSIEQHQELSKFIGGYLQLAIQGEISDLQISFWQALGLHLKWALLIWLLGISVIGVPLVAGLNFLKGLLIGFSVGYVSSQMAWKGLWFSLFSIMPSNLFMVPAILMLSAGSISFAFYLVKMRKTIGFRLTKSVLFRYLTLLLMMMLLCCCSALTEVYLVPILFQWFAPFFV